MWQARSKTAHSGPKNRKSCRGHILWNIRDPAWTGIHSLTFLRPAATRHKPAGCLAWILGVLTCPLICPCASLTNPLTNCSQCVFFSSGLKNGGRYNLQASPFQLGFHWHYSVHVLLVSSTQCHYKEQKWKCQHASLFCLDVYIHSVAPVTCILSFLVFYFSMIQCARGMLLSDDS